MSTLRAALGWFLLFLGLGIETAVLAFSPTAGRVNGFDVLALLLVAAGVTLIPIGRGGRRR